MLNKINDLLSTQPIRKETSNEKQIYRCPNCKFEISLNKFVKDTYGCLKCRSKAEFEKVTISKITIEFEGSIPEFSFQHCGFDGNQAIGEMSICSDCIELLNNKNKKEKY